jgi:hypothetical protein
MFLSVSSDAFLNFMKAKCVCKLNNFHIFHSLIQVKNIHLHKILSSENHFIFNLFYHFDKFGLHFVSRTEKTN